MIATKFRVPRQFIPYILKKGSSYHSDLFIVRYVENKEEFSRYRVIVSKKLSAQAVKRNKLRRQIYEAIRTNSPEAIVKSPSYDSILIPKKRITTTKFTAIEVDIKRILQKHCK